MWGLLTLALATAATSGNLAMARFGQPTSLDCPAEVPQVRGGSEDLMVETPVRGGSACYYPGLRSDIEAQQVRFHATDAERIADLLNELLPQSETKSVHGCPRDTGEEVLFLFQGDGEIRVVRVHATGCVVAFNGTRNTYLSRDLYDCLYVLFPGMRSHDAGQMRGYQEHRPTTC